MKKILTAIAVAMTILSSDIISAGMKMEQPDEITVIPANKHEKWAKEKAESIADSVNSPDYQKRVQAETDRLVKDIYNKPTGEYYKKDNTDAKRENDGQSGLSNNERVYVFVSASIPLQTIRNYASAIDKAKDPNVIMVMRGFLNGMQDINSTIVYASSVLTRDPSCGNVKAPCPTFNANLQIDPYLFRRFQVNQVPTIVYAPNVKRLSGAGSEGIEGNAAVQQYYKLSGDAALDYHIEKINEEAHQKSIDGLVKTLRKGFY